MRSGWWVVVGGWMSEVGWLLVVAVTGHLVGVAGDWRLATRGCIVDTYLNKSTYILR